MINDLIAQYGALHAELVNSIDGSDGIELECHGLKLDGLLYSIIQFECECVSQIQTKLNFCFGQIEKSEDLNFCKNVAHQCMDELNQFFKSNTEADFNKSAPNSLCDTA